MDKWRKALTLYSDYHGMISDKVRMESYKKAIFEVVEQGDVVVDLGSGLGILAFFAVQAGASKVYAIEKMDSIDLAMKVASINGFDDKIVFLRDNSKNVELPEKVDVIISETLGSFAIDENTLDFTIDAMDRFLKDDGRLIPSRLQMWVAPVEAREAYDKINVWNNINGIDFSPAKEEIVTKILIEELSAQNYLANPAIFTDIDLYTVKSPSIKADMVFEANRTGTLHGFGGWFKCWLSPNISFDTAPTSKLTHWKQSIFPARTPVRIGNKTIVTLELMIAPKTSEGDDTRITYNFGCIPRDDINQGKVGRNDPCHCGSGKKFKKCCGS